jgi:calcineurin-like phosphoesterase family protein
VRYFLTADLHLGHANIIKYCKRPFKDVAHMNESLIRNWNQRVKPDDVVYHLGDFCFKNSSDKGEGQRTSAFDWLNQLTGQKVFIRGNHDRNNSLKVLINRALIEYAGEEYEMVHAPDDASGGTLITFCGHVHERWKYRLYGETILINVGVDVNGFMPQPIEDILGEFKTWKRNNALEPYFPWKGKDNVS